MEMGGMIDLLFLASGIYLIYTAVAAKKHGDIAGSVMLSKGNSEKDIQDKTGFIGYLYKKLLLAGTVIVAASIIQFVNDYYIHSKAVTWVGIIMILSALILYGWAYKNGQKRYMSKQDRISGKVK